MCSAFISLAARRRAVSALVETIEAALQPFHPRPHWAKVLARLTPVTALPAAGGFRRLTEAYDPRCTFRTPYLSRTLLPEPPTRILGAQSRQRCAVTAGRQTRWPRCSRRACAGGQTVALTAVLGPTVRSDNVDPLLYRLIRPSAGSVKVLGLPAGSGWRRPYGLMPQARALVRDQGNRSSLSLPSPLVRQSVPVPALVERLGLSVRETLRTDVSPAASNRQSNLAGALVEAARAVFLDEPQPAWTRMLDAPPGCCYGSSARTVSPCC